MKQSVKDAFVPFTVPLEGEVRFLYPDVKNLVSIGIGNLVDPMSLAMSLPFVHADGTPATRPEIAAEWQKIKTLPPDAKGRTAAQLGHTYAKEFVSLFLTEEGVSSLVLGKLEQNEAFLQSRFPGFDEWPADAQMATLSMAWACGPAFRFPKLAAALKALDFATASVECFMPEERTITGLRPRNRANRILFMNASMSPDAEVLFWPRDLEAESRAEQQPIVHPDVPMDPPDDT